MKYLITGGCGFIGSNLALEVLKRNEELFVLDNLYRAGSSRNLELLKAKGDFVYFPFDIRNTNDVEVAVQKSKPDFVFHLAGQVAMTTSIENPRLDYETNALGTFNLLDAVRKYSPDSVILYSSTNNVYGDFEYLDFQEKEKRYVCVQYPDGFPESIPLDFHSPYGCSKGCADQYLLDAARIFGLKTIVFRHSSMYGINQSSTYDQGWIGWFCQKALEIKSGTLKSTFTVSGNGKQVRDVLFNSDVTALYFKLKDCPAAYGQVFNIGGGLKNSLSLLELFDVLERKLGVKMNYQEIDWRQSDQKVFVADNRKVFELSGWQPLVSYDEGLDLMIDYLRSKSL